MRGWHAAHYAERGELRDPEQALMQAYGIAAAVRAAIKDKRLESAREREWAEDIAVGADLLGDAELYGDIGVQGWDAVDYLRDLGRRALIRQEEDAPRRAMWLAGAAAIGFALGRLLF